MARIVRRTAATVATVIFYLGVVLALVLALHIVLVLLSANTGNVIAVTVKRYADLLGGPFLNLFSTPDPKLTVAVDYGLPAVLYLVAGTAVSGLVRGLGRMAR
jgi:hypothetical protein